MGVAPPDFADTLAGDMQDVITDLRSLHEEFGTRRFRVVLLWIAWSGPLRGQGSPSVAREVELRPVPEVYDDAQLAYRFRAGGAEREGDWQVSQICQTTEGRLVTSELLRGLYEGTPLAPSMEFLVELRPVQPGAKALRFRVAGEPVASVAGWTLNLKHVVVDSPTEGVTAGTVTF